MKAIKVQLPIVDKNGVPVGKRDLAEIVEEYSFIEDGDLPDWLLDRAKRRGETLDYGKTLLAMVRRADNPRVGMSFEEMETLYPLVEKLKAAKPGGSVLLSEDEFKIVCEKIKKPYSVSYNETFYSFVKAILSSDQVSLVEEVEAG
jgi:hypothetical protein